MMKIILERYGRTHGEVYIPNSVRERNLQYATFSHWAFNWFSENYALLEKPTVDDYVSIQALFDRMKQSDIFSNLGRLEKRAFTKAYLANLFSNSVLYGKYFMEKYQPTVNGQQLCRRNVLIGFARIDDRGNIIPHYDEDQVDPTI